MEVPDFARDQPSLDDDILIDAQSRLAGAFVNLLSPVSRNYLKAVVAASQYLEGAGDDILAVIDALKPRQTLGARRDVIKALQALVAKESSDAKQRTIKIGS